MDQYIELIENLKYKIEILKEIISDYDVLIESLSERLQKKAK